MSYGDDEVPEQPIAPERPADGRPVVRHLEVTEDQAGQRLDNFVHRLLGSDLPRSRIYRVIRKGEVRVNGHRAGPDTRLQARDKIRIPPVKVRPASEVRQPSNQLMGVLRDSIVAEDDNLLVLDKPSGVAVHGGSGVSFGAIEGLRALRPGESLELVHRLDRDTSGVLLVAKNTAALRTVHALLRDGAFEKRYLALVKGKWDLGRKRIDIPLRTDLRVGGERTVRADASGKPSLSEFRPVQFFGKRATLMEVTIFTGRTHQIRVHAQHAGHPVAGDEKYGDEEFNAEMKAFGLNRMFLHAHSVSFEWPAGRDASVARGDGTSALDRSGAGSARARSGEFSVNTPLPPDLAASIDKLAAEKTRSRRR